MLSLSISELALIAGVTLFAATIGGIAGYGTGLLLPLVLAPAIGIAAVVPVIGASAILTNGGRVAAYSGEVDWRLAAKVGAAALPFCALSAFGFTLLSGRSVAVLIGGFLILAVPLRYLLKRWNFTFSGRSLTFAAIAYGALAGGTSGAGVILISLLMAAGLEGKAVVATDAAISFGLGLVKTGVFLANGLLPGRLLAIALFIGVFAVPAAFIAKAIAGRMPVKLHTAILDAVVIFGGLALIFGPPFK